MTSTLYIAHGKADKLSGTQRTIQAPTTKKLEKQVHNIGNVTELKQPASAYAFDCRNLSDICRIAEEYVLSPDIGGG